MNLTVAVVGLGYVGLPLAVGFGKVRPTLGFDISQRKVQSLLAGIDPAGEVTGDDLAAASMLTVSTSPEELAGAEYIIVAVPTPVDEAHRPDLSPLIGASEVIGRHMCKGVIVIFESTVFPGATEEVCIPVLEKVSGLKWRVDFNVGYSPERINPGDKEHTLENIVKVVSGDNEATLKRVAELYGSIVRAGVYRASSIKVAEAAKVIENSQRDLNIAFMNELAIIFDRLGIDTMDVLEAAGTKWNFLPFRPGLVGGHCIGVDPYYLTHKAEMVGYHPQVILAGRRINDGMGEYIARKAIKLMAQTGINLFRARVNVLGITFKENCPDVRNSQVPNIVRELEDHALLVSVCDHVADAAEAFAEYGIALITEHEMEPADALILAVAHQDFLKLGTKGISKFAKPGSVVIDVKSALNVSELKDLGFKVWRL